MAMRRTQARVEMRSIPSLACRIFRRTSRYETNDVKTSHQNYGQSRKAYDRGLGVFQGIFCRSRKLDATLYCLQDFVAATIKEKVWENIGRKVTS